MAGSYMQKPAAAGPPQKLAKLYCCRMLLPAFVRLHLKRPASKGPPSAVTDSLGDERRPSSCLQS